MPLRTLNVVAGVIAVGLGGLCLGGLAPHALAQDQTMVGAFSDWTVWQYMEARNRVCYMTSRPLDKEPRAANRNDVYIHVSHQPGARDVVSVVNGYTFEANAVVTVTVDAAEFKLFTKDDTAWAYTPQQDGQLARAMAAGARIIVKGKSNRGTETTDTYSLSGFTAAHTALDRACPAR